MSLKRNVIATYLSQLYVTLIGIALVPLYLEYLGAEAFGLVGFFTMLQAWFNLLDVGLTPALSRETARQGGGASDALSFRRMVRALEGVFLLLALVGGAALFAASGTLARHWLNAVQLPVGEVQNALELIAIAVAMRWLAGLYRSIVSGNQRLVWLAGFNSAVATLRFVGVIPVMVVFGANANVFFTFQVVVAAVELAGLMLFGYGLLPRVKLTGLIPWSWAPLRPMLKFSLSLAFTSTVWVVVTQTDKLVLSSVLPLAEYGYFSLAVLVASGVLVISAPVSAAIMPRMAMLDAQGDHVALIRIYRQSTQLVAVICGAASITAALFAERLLWAWTGNQVLAQQAAPLLALYALGNGIAAIAAFPFYLQYAKGDLRLHFIGNAVFSILLVPSIILAAKHFGGIGAGYVWLGMNAISFLAWLPLVHRKFEPGLNIKWYFNDVLFITAPIALTGLAMSQHLSSADDRWLQGAEVIAAGLVAAAVGVAASSEARAAIHIRWTNYSRGKP